MPANFILVVTTDHPEIKPPLSGTACDYLAKFITEKILHTKHIILKSNWSVMVGMVFSSAVHYSSDGIVLASRVRTVNALHAKLYEIEIPLRNIEGSHNPNEKMLELIWEGLTLFFTTNYKKVTTDFMKELRQQLNMGYLLSLFHRSSTR